MKRTFIYITLIIAIAMVLVWLWAACARAADNYHQYMSRSSQSGYDIQFMKHYVAWDGVGYIAGTWDSDNLVYEFVVPMEDTTYYRSDVFYKVMENGAIVLDSLMIGDIVAYDNFEAHRDSSAAHGVAGDVVGDTDTQTLTNKTLDGDDNTVQDLHGWSLESGTSVRPIRIHPDVAEDMYIHMVEGDANGATIQVADTAGTTDGVLTIKADSVDFQDDAGNDIVLSGIVLGTADNVAVPKSSLDSLKTRVDNLEVGGTFAGSPVASVDLGLVGRGDRGFHVQADFDMDPDNRDAVARFELYYGGSNLFIDEGTTSAAELGILRAGAFMVLRRGNEARRHIIQSFDEIVHVYVVAFDAAGTAYNSERAQISPGGNPDDPGRDGNGELITIWRTIPGFVNQASTSSGDAAAEYVTWVQSNTTATTKDRRGYVYRSDDNRMYVSFYSKTGAGTGYVRVRIMDDTTEKKSVTFSTELTSYPSTPQSIEIDLTSGLTNGVLYEIEIDVWNSASNTTSLDANVQVGVESNVSIY
jgi:hypothetical protein